MTHVLVATDGSEGALDAANFLYKLASPASVQQITVLAVISPIESTPFFNEMSFAGGSVFTQETWNSLNRSLDTNAQGAVTKTRDALTRLTPNINVIVRTGSPAEEIVDAAKHVGADLIVLGSRGLNGVRSVLLGSVSDRVLHLAHCPVLVVRPSEHVKKG